MTLDMASLEARSRTIRGQVVAMAGRARTAHLASALSCVDLLTAAYWGGALRLEPERHDAPDRDRVILSKGHAIAAHYAVLAGKGYFEESLLETYNQDGGSLPEHPGVGCAPGIEWATGSLGHGLPVGLGMALGARIRKEAGKVLVILSDGECNEGSVWEAALMAPKHRLGNLLVVVDFNKWQATDRSEDVMALAPLRDKWAAFGWRALEVDGHDLSALVEAYHAAYANPDTPTALVAHTVKGKGVSFMEDDNNWHYRAPNEEEVTAAHRELGLA